MIETKICGRFEETVCKDRISDLPDDLLVSILDLVPTKDAVATMFLSKRWRYIWTMKLTLEYKDMDADSDDDDDDDHEEQGVKTEKSVWQFLDKSLQLHKAPVIDSLCIELGPHCPTDVDVGKWVARAVDRGVLVLKFKLLWSANPTRLPKSLYTCETLVELKLSHKILVDFPSSSSCLQSLKLLELHYVVYKDEDTLLRFLSSCPILEFLFVERKNDDNVKRFTVKVPSLCRLCYYNGMHQDNSRCLVIDTPALEKLTILDNSGDDCSIVMMPRLQNAFIYTLSYLHVMMQLVCCRAIYSSRLTTLRIRPTKSGWIENLMVLLRNSPKLKDLKVDCLFGDEELPPASWNNPSSIPECLLSNLEFFTLEEYGGGEKEEQFLTYILANAKCLKTAKIYFTPDLSLEEQHVMKEKLKDFPKVSTTSQLLFN